MTCSTVGVTPKTSIFPVPPVPHGQMTVMGEGGGSLLSGARITVTDR